MNQARDSTVLGASGGTSPPVLPIKQRRSGSSSASIQDLELKEENLVPAGPPMSPFSDVFTPTFCNALDCPVHHCYGNHSVRFFSDEIPPPVPKKTQKRTQSYPGETLDPSSLDQGERYNYENPLYMITSFHVTNKTEDIVQDERHEIRCLGKFTFETTDEELQKILKSCQSHEAISTSIQMSQLQFLKDMMKKIEKRTGLSEHEFEATKTSHPNDFVLCDQKWDDFHLLHSPKFPSRMFAAKVQRRGLVSAQLTSISHLNIEQIIACFPRCSTMDQTYQLKQTPEPSHGHTPQQETVADFLANGFDVTVVRDFPLGTLEDFVQVGRSLHFTLPGVYERRLCLLALQLVQALQELERFKVKCKELKPNHVTLVWPKSVFDEKNYSKNAACEAQIDMWIKRVNCQRFWEMYGTPRLVLKSQYESEQVQGMSQAYQLRNLLRYCLHLDIKRPSDWKVQDTPYSKGLLLAVTQLTSEQPAPLSDIAEILQTLLWGPQHIFQPQHQLETSFWHNWLLLKRSLFVLQLAEKGLFQNQRSLDWEDYLCMQYLSLSEPDCIRIATNRLGFYD